YRQPEALVVRVEEVAPAAEAQQLAVGVDLDAACPHEDVVPLCHARPTPPCGPAGTSPTCTADTPKVCSLYDTPVKPAAAMRSFSPSGSRNAFTVRGR